MMPGAPQRAPGAREGNRGTTLQPARPDHTPGTGSSDKPLPGPVTTLRPQPATQRRALPVPGAELAIPRSLPPCRRRSRRSRWSARSAARTNDLEVRQDDGHTRPRGRPGFKDHSESHSARRALHRPRRTPAEPLDTKRLSFGAAGQPVAHRPVPAAERTICCRGRCSAAARSAGVRQRLATACGPAAGHARPVSGANASRCLRRPWPGRPMTALGFYGGSCQDGPAFGRARSRALSRLSAMPWA
jgi:hypothetical protein